MKSGSLFHSAGCTGVAYENAQFTNFLSDHVTTKSAWDECVRRARLDWRNEQGVRSEET